jgi:hypothetical protein
VDPTVPESLWKQLESNLEPCVAPRKSFDKPPSPRVSGTMLALAASLLVATGIGVAVFRAQSPPKGAHLAMNFDGFLEEFAKQPEAAQQRLLAHHGGRKVTLVEAASALGYEPLAAKGLPQDWSVESAYLLEMPCCTCAQLTCKNQQGQTIAIFEHEAEQPVSFGDRAAIQCRCRSVPTNVIQMADGVAASWRAGERHITIVGATDLDQVAEFVAFYAR